MDPIYLDNNATTAILPEVAEAMQEACAAGYANPASQHGPGRRARRVLEDCRERVAEILGAVTAGVDTDRVVFTSGGTESNNLAILGLSGALGQHGLQRSSARIAISAIEHPSIAMAAASLSDAAWQVDTLPVDGRGIVSTDLLADRIGPDTKLVSVMLGNNETGILQPVREIAHFCRQRGILCHTDAVQAVGKIPVSFRDLGVDAMSCTAHKLHGPRGVGVLVIGGGVDVQPILRGGFQQGGIRPGTESVALAIGLCQALEAWHREQQSRSTRLATLRDRFETAVQQGDPEAVVIGKDAPRLPHTSNIAFVGLDRQALQMALDLDGIACSTGSACASGSSEASPVLLAMGCPEALIRSSLRFSISALSTADEVEEAAGRILLTCKRLRQT